MKQITVFGANGKIGSRIVKLLLKKGYKVVAFVHENNNVSSKPNLRIFQGDVHNPVDVQKATEGSDVVVSALGSWGAPKKDVLGSGMHSIIPAMQANKIKRIVSLTGSDAKDPHDKPSIFNRVSHAFFEAAAFKIKHDGERHMRLLRASNLDWTVLRSPVMNDAGEKGHYALRMTIPGVFATINRDDVAAAMVYLAETGEYSRKSPIIYRK